MSVTSIISQLVISSSLSKSGYNLVDGSPSALSVSVLSGTSVELSWTIGSTNHEGHSIERSTNGTTYSVIGTVTGTTATYQDTGLTLATLYYYRVRAYRVTAYSNYCTPATVTTPVILSFADYSDGTLPMLTGATWAVDTGKAVNTPTEGVSELLTDGGLENWTDANNLTSWTETIIGGTIAREATIKRTGNYSAAITVSATGQRIEISQVPTVALGEYFITRLYARSNTASNAFSIRHEGQSPGTQTISPSDSTFTEWVATSVKRATAGFFVGVGNAAGNANDILYVDDISTRLLTKTTLYATTNNGLTDVTTKSYWTKTINTLSGVIMNIDDIANPQNYVLFVTNGASNNTFLLKCVAGTVSVVVSTNVTTNSNSQLIELRKSGTTYQQFINGVQVGADQTIADASIISNTIHGLFSTYAANTCDRFYCGDSGDVIEVPDAATISDYYKYVSSGDTLSLASGGTYTFAAGVNGFSTLPSGTSTRRTTVNGNGSTITGGATGINLGTAKAYFTFNDLTLAEQTLVGVILGQSVVMGVSYVTFNNVHAYSSEATYIDTFKNQYDCDHLEYNDCVAGPCVGALATCDGFEDWDSEDVTYNNCVAHGFQNGAELLNNGHGFETYAQNAGEICRRITYNNCHAYDCRVGFSCEGGPLSVAHEDVVANNCTTATIDLYDASGVNGSTIYVTAGTLTNRNGNVVEL